MAHYSPHKQLLQKARQHVLALHPLPRGIGKAWEPHVRLACRRLVQELDSASRGLLHAGERPPTWTREVVEALLKHKDEPVVVEEESVAVPPAWRLNHRGFDMYAQDPEVKAEVLKLYDEQRDAKRHAGKSKKQIVQVISWRCWRNLTSVQQQPWVDAAIGSRLGGRTRQRDDTSGRYVKSKLAFDDQAMLIEMVPTPV